MCRLKNESRSMSWEARLASPNLLVGFIDLWYGLPLGKYILETYHRQTAYEPDRVSLCAQAAFQASENQSHLL
jgi:hypothetical protein